MKKVTLQEEHFQENPDLHKDYKVGDTVELMNGDDNCDKNNPSDPHYNQAGDYTSGCKWIPDIG